MDKMSHGQQSLVNESNLCGRGAHVNQSQKRRNERGAVARDPHGASLIVRGCLGRRPTHTVNRRGFLDEWWRALIMESTRH